MSLTYKHIQRPSFRFLQNIFYVIWQATGTYQDNPHTAERHISETSDFKLELLNELQYLLNSQHNKQLFPRLQ